MSLDDVLNQEIEAGKNTPFEGAVEQPAQQGSFGGIVNLFRVETGREPLEVYQTSPLCFDGSRAMAKIVRGVSGFLAHYDFADITRSALLDIIFGGLEWAKEKSVNGQRIPQN